MNELQIEKFMKYIEDFCDQENLVMTKHSTASSIPLSIEIGKKGYFINGKEGYISMNGDLPYKGYSSGDYIKAFGYNQHLECAEFLASKIIKFYNENEIKIKEDK